MINLVIYGISHQAQQLKIFLDELPDVVVHGFVVDKEYKKCNELLGLPVYEFESVNEIFSPSKFQIVLSFGYKNMVRNREDKFRLCKSKGYIIYTFISPRAIVYTDKIGEGALIYPGVFLAPFTSIGKGVFIENGCSVAHNTTIEDFCFLAPNVSLCGDCYVEKNCFLGSNCTVAGSVHLKQRTLVAAGAVWLHDTLEAECIFPQKSINVYGKIPEKYI